MNNIQVWKTIKLGTGLKTADDFRGALKAGGYQINDSANEMLGKPAFTVAAKETEIELVKVLAKELGFKKGASRQEIYQRAQELGLKLCPNEVGPQLRLQYKNQPLNEWLLVAMEPIPDLYGCFRAFSVEPYGSVRWVSSLCGRPYNSWDTKDQFVFCK